MLARVAGDAGTMVAVGCETEPVSANEEFRAFAQHVLDVVSVEGPDAVENLEEERVELVAKIGENIAVRGDGQVGGGGRRGGGRVRPSARRTRSACSFARGRRPSSRVSSPCTSPSRTRRTSPATRCPAAVAAEREVYEKLPDVQSKPEEIRAKIVEGMLAKRFFAESVLADQAWIHDDSLTVGKALAEHGAEVREFVRYALAE